MKEMRATPLRSFCPGTPALPEPSLFLARLRWTQSFPQAAGSPRVEREGRNTTQGPMPASRDLGWLCKGGERKV